MSKTAQLLAHLNLPLEPKDCTGHSAATKPLRFLRGQTDCNALGDCPNATWSPLRVIKSIQF